MSKIKPTCPYCGDEYENVYRPEGMLVPLQCVHDRSA